MSSGLSQMPERDASFRGHVNDSDVDKKRSTAKEILKFAGTWKGDDLEECLHEVYTTRGVTVCE